MKKATPYYIFKPKELKKNIDSFKSIQNLGVDIFFATKSNYYPPLLKEVIAAEFGFDVASKEELEFVLSLGANPDKISFSSPTKFLKDIKYATKVGVNYFAFDSIPEAKKILGVNKKAKLVVRLSVENKDASFNLSNKFGFFKNTLKKVLRENLELLRENLVGITFHVGSQNTNLNAWMEAYLQAKEVSKYGTNLGYKIECLNIGGGISARYLPTDPSIKKSIIGLIKLIKTVKKDRVFKKIIIEPGRAISASSMDLHASIINIKDYKNPPEIDLDISVFSGLIEPLEHFEYNLISDYKSKRRRVYRVVGYSCDGYDIIKREALLPADLKIGEKIIIEKAGAYTFVYKNFHLKSFPKIY